MTSGPPVAFLGFGTGGGRNGGPAPDTVSPLWVVGGYELGRRGTRAGPEPAGRARHPRQAAVRCTDSGDPLRVVRLPLAESAFLSLYTETVLLESRKEILRPPPRRSTRA